MNGSISLSGLELRSSAQITVNETPDWHDWFYDERSYQSVIGSGGALTQADAQSLSSEIGSLGLAADGQVSGLSAESVSATGSVIGNASALHSIAGVELQSEHGTVTADVIEPINATVSLDSILLNTTAGTVRASGGSVVPDNPGGSVYVRPLAVRDATASLKTIRLVAVNGTIIAQGSTVAGAVATVSGVSVSAEAADISAKGVLDIDDIELLLLLAA